MKTDAARLLIWRAAVNAQNGLPDVPRLVGGEVLCNEIAREVCGHAVQLMGGYGYSSDYPMERRLRDRVGMGNCRGRNRHPEGHIAAAMVGGASTNAAEAYPMR